MEDAILYIFINLCPAKTSNDMQSLNSCCMKKSKWGWGSEEVGWRGGIAIPKNKSHYWSGENMVHNNSILCMLGKNFSRRQTDDMFSYFS